MAAPLREPTYLRSTDSTWVAADSDEFGPYMGTGSGYDPPPQKKAPNKIKIDFSG